MILDKFVKVKVNNRYLKFYESLGYGKLRQGDYIDLAVEYLPKCSSTKINAACDYCNKSLIVEYEQYNLNFSNGGKFCCFECKPKKYRETCLLKYGVDNIIKVPETHEKIKSVSLEKYGVTSYTKLEKFKDDHKEKMKKKYGVDSFSKTKEWLEKQKETSLKKWGVENASQNPEIFSKQQKGRYEIHNYKGTDIYYQGSFECDFLDNFYNKIKITRGPVIEYLYENKAKQYFSDFYLPDFNLIVEIKSSYTFELSKTKNIAKQNRCIDLGFNHIFVIDKDYFEINKLINEKLLSNN